MKQVISNKISELFNETRCFNERVFKAASKIDCLADIYISAVKEAIDTHGENAFDDSGKLKVDEVFNKSLMGLQELGIQTSLSSVKQHAALKMN